MIAITTSSSTSVNPGARRAMAYPPDPGFANRSRIFGDSTEAILLQQSIILIIQKH